MFDDSVVRILGGRSKELEPLCDALRARYLALVTKEVEHWKLADVNPETLRGSLDSLSKLLPAERGREIPGVEELRRALERKYRSLFDGEPASKDLETMQGEIARWRNLPANECDLGARLRFERLAHRYFRALGVFLRDEAGRGQLVLGFDGTWLKDPAEVLVRDMRAWHPLFGLAVLRRILDEGPQGMHELALGPPPAVHREHVQIIRATQYATPRMSEEEKTRQARALLESMLQSEARHFWGVLGRTVLDRAATTLAAGAVFGVDVLKHPQCTSDCVCES